MRTVNVPLYRINELEPHARKRAIQTEREHRQYFIADEVTDAVLADAETLGIRARPDTRGADSQSTVELGWNYDGVAVVNMTGHLDVPAILAVCRKLAPGPEFDLTPFAPDWSGKLSHHALLFVHFCEALAEVPDIDEVPLELDAEVVTGRTGSLIVEGSTYEPAEDIQTPRVDALRAIACDRLEDYLRAVRSILEETVADTFDDLDSDESIADFIEANDFEFLRTGEFFNPSICRPGT